MTTVPRSPIYSFNISGSNNESKLVVESGLGKITSSPTELTHELATANTNLATANSNLDIRTSELASANTNLATANTNLATTTTNLATANTNLTTRTIQLADTTNLLNSEITFLLNGNKVTVKNPDPTLSLLDFLRYNTTITGTRKNCNQGGCGVCIVMQSFKDKQDGTLRNISINSCLKRLVQCNNTAITTTEGIGSRKRGFHAVQERISQNQGIQCGACTPGQVMSIYTALQANTFTQTITDSSNVAKLLDGNLCRCSCYLGIIKTAQSFTPAFSSNVVYTGGIGGVAIPYVPANDVNASSYNTDSKSLGFLNNNTLSNILMYKSTRFDVTYYVVPTLSDIQLVIQKRNDISLSDIEFVNGNSGAGVYGKDYKKVYIDITYVAELNIMSSTSLTVTYGGGVQYNKIVQNLKAFNDDKLTNIANHIYHIAGQSVRNVGTLGGALALTKHKGLISDSVTCLMATDASVNVIKISTNGSYVSATLSIDDYLADTTSTYKTIIVSVVIPKKVPYEYFISSRLAGRLVNAVSYVNAAYDYKLDSTNKIVSCKIVYGAVNDTGIPKRALLTQTYLANKEFIQATFNGALTLLNSDISMQALSSHATEEVEGKSGGTRQEHVGSLLYKSFIKMQAIIGTINIKNYSAIETWEDRDNAISRLPLVDWGDDKPVSYFRYYDISNTANLKKDEKIKSDSQIIASGEAKYTDDIPYNTNILYAKLVFSSIASGQVDMANSQAMLTATRAIPGVELVLDCSNEQLNFAGAIGSPSLLGFHKGLVISSTSAVIAVVYATSPDLAEKVGNEMVFAYKNVVAPKSFTQAIIAGGESLGTASTATSFGNRAVNIPAFTQVKTPDPSGDFYSDASRNAFNDASGLTVSEGSLKLPDVLNQYLETLTTAVFRNPIDGKYLIYTSSQYILAAKVAADYLGLSMNDYIIKILRVGGAFGGKQWISILVTYYTLLGAIRTGRDVKLLLGVKDDARYNNGRFEILSQQRVSYDASGKIFSLRRQNYSAEASRGRPSNKVVPFEIPNLYDGADQVLVNRGISAWWRSAGRIEINFVKPLPIDIIVGAMADLTLNQTTDVNGIKQFNLKFDDIMERNLVKDLSNSPARILTDIYGVGATGGGTIGVSGGSDKFPNDWLTLEPDPRIFETLLNELHDISYAARDNYTISQGDVSYNYLARKASVQSFNNANRWKKRALVTVPLTDEIGSNGSQYGSKGSMATIQFNTGNFYNQPAAAPTTAAPVPPYLPNSYDSDNYRVKLYIEIMEAGTGVTILAAQTFANAMKCPLDKIDCETGDSILFPQGNTGMNGSQQTGRQLLSIRYLVRKLRTLWGEVDASGNEIPGQQLIDISLVDIKAMLTPTVYRSDSASTTATQNIVTPLTSKYYLNATTSVLDISLITQTQWDAMTYEYKLPIQWQYRVKKNQYNLTALYNIMGSEPHGVIRNIKLCTMTMAEVEVDCLTGTTTIREMNTVSSLGQILNGAIHFGQCEGGTIMGLGPAFTEGRYFDASAIPLNYDTWTYKIPSVYDLPLKITHEVHKPETPLNQVTNAMVNPDVRNAPEYPVLMMTEASVFSGIAAFYAAKEAIREFRFENNLSTSFTLNLPASPANVLEALGGTPRTGTATSKYLL